MATSINQFNDDKELLLMRIKDLEFVYDVSEFKCKRCEKVLIQHYISDCGHAFCTNCKRLLGDGSGRWPCPHCHEFVKKIDYQDFEFERKLFDQRVHCANTKYGCSFTCSLKELGEHLRTCEFTRENALPVLYKETNTIEAVLEQLSSITRIVETMEEKMTKIEINQETFENKLKMLDDRIETVNSVFPEQILKINMEIEDSKKNQLSDKWISTIDKMKSKISNLNKKSDLWLEVLELKEEKINKAISQQKLEVEDDFKNLSSTLQKEIKTNTVKLNEANVNFATKLKNTDSNIEVNRNELKVLEQKTDSCLEKNDELNRLTQSLQDKNIYVKNSLSDKDNKIKNINKKLDFLEALNKKFDELTSDIKPMKDEFIILKNQQGKFDGALKVILNRIEHVSTNLHENTTKLENSIQSECSILNEKTELVSQNLKSKDEKMNKIKFQLKQEIGNEMHVKTNKLQNLIQRECSILNEKSDLLSKDLNLKDEKMDKINSQLKNEFKNDWKKTNSSLAARITKLKNACENEVKHLKNVEVKVEKNQHELTALKTNLCWKTSTNESVDEINALVEKIVYLKTQIKTVTESVKHQSNQLKPVIEKNKNVSTQLKSLEMTVKTFKSDWFHYLQSKIELINQQIQPVMLKDVYWKRPADFVWQIPRANEVLNDNVIHKDMKSELFQLNDYPVIVRARLSFAADSFCVRLSTKSGTQPPPQPSIYLIIRNQVYERAWDVMKLASKPFQSPNQNCDYVFEKIAKSQLRGFFNNYVINNKLLLEFHVESPWMSKHVCSCDGTLSWAVDNYKKRKELESSGYVSFHESPYFYTKLNGYRAQIRFWLNFGHGDYLCAGIHFLTGENDDFLKREIPHKITITILNPKNPIGHIRKSEIYNPAIKPNKAQCFRICSKEEIDGFVANDIFYYHAEIEEM